MYLLLLFTSENLRHLFMITLGSYSCFAHKIGHYCLEFFHETMFFLNSNPDVFVKIDCWDEALLMFYVIVAFVFNRFILSNITCTWMKFDLFPSFIVYCLKMYIQVFSQCLVFLTRNCFTVLLMSHTLLFILIWIYLQWCELI